MRYLLGKRLFSSSSGTSIRYFRFLTVKSIILTNKTLMFLTMPLKASIFINRASRFPLKRSGIVLGDRHLHFLYMLRCFPYRMQPTPLEVNKASYECYNGKDSDLFSN